MSFNASSYFAGVGTVVVMMAIGFGAGMNMTGMFDDPSLDQPNKLERRATGVSEKPVDDFTRTEIKAPTEARPADTKIADTKPAETKATETRTIGSAATPSVTAPEPPKATAQAEPAPMAPSQRMRQSFDWQPRASQPQPATPVPQAATRSAPQPAASSPTASAPAPAAPQTAQSEPEPASVAAQPATDANAAARDVEAEKAKAAVDRKKAQQRKLAADRRREREARINAAADWLRTQPADVYAGPRNAYAQPRFGSRDYFGRW